MGTGGIALFSARATDSISPSIIGHGGVHNGDILLFDDGGYHVRALCGETNAVISRDNVGVGRGTV